MVMAREQWTSGQAIETRAAKVSAAQAVLADAVDGLRSGEDWTGFLRFQAQLYDYSTNNVMLLVAQHNRLYAEGKVATPTPSYVASYSKWQQLGRQVEKGQTGLAIIAPLRGIRREAVDPDGNTRRLDGDEQPAAGEREVKSGFMRGFTVEKVFSAEQTTGDPLPEPPSPKLLEGEAPHGLGEAVMGLIHARGFTVSTVPSKSFLQGANGLTTFTAKTVQIRADMDDAAMVKTLIHEAAHVMLHDPAVDEAGVQLPRGHKEVEAESVAFIVARVHGLPTDDYSFAYVAGWAGEDHGKVIAKTAQRVAATAKQIIAASPAEHSPGGKAALRLTAPSPNLAATADTARETAQVGV